MLDSYTESLIREIKNWGGVLRRPVFDTVYFGGGTPSVLDSRLIGEMIRAARENFNIS